MFDAYLLPALIVLQVLDLITTYLCIARKKGHEANPLMAWVFAKLGLPVGLLLTKGTVIAALLYGGAALPPVAFYVLIAFYSYVVHSNIRIVRRMAT